MSENLQVPLPGRLTSLDAFRGFTIAAMFLVNNPGSWSYVLPPLEHAKWNGWTFTDLIFPFFLFIVGVAMVFSITRRLEKGATRRSIYAKVVRRTLIIFALGLFLNLFPHFDFSHVRIPGVLQRIAVCYFFAAVVMLHLGIRGQAVTAAVLLLAYWAAMMLIPVPGVGAGILTPDGNLAAYIDRHLLAGHLWAVSRTWDPEGILSTVPAIATTLFGALTGHWLRSGRDRREIAAWLFVVGDFALVLGALWNYAFPINKNLWTSSYAVFMAGMALNFLGVFYWLMDVKGYQRWAKPFVIWGMNAIAVYVFIGIFARIMIYTHVSGAPGAPSLKGWLWEHVFEPLAGPWLGSLLHALVYVAISYLFVWALYRKKVFIRV